MSKILIVDDDKLIVSALSIRLRTEGHDVVAAYDGTTAVEQARRHHPALILMDINLPFSNGLRSVRQIRDANGIGDTPVIFMTASKVPALREQANSLGAAGFLEKPYEANELVALVRHVLTAAIAPSSPAPAQTAAATEMKMASIPMTPGTSGTET